MDSHKGAFIPGALIRAEARIQYHQKVLDAGDVIPGLIRDGPDGNNPSTRPSRLEPDAQWIIGRGRYRSDSMFRNAGQIVVSHQGRLIIHSGDDVRAGYESGMVRTINRVFPIVRLRCGRPYRSICVDLRQLQRFGHSCGSLACQPRGTC